MEKKKKKAKTTTSKKKVEEKVVSENSNIDNKSHNSGIYFSYGFRIISFIVLFLVFFAASMYLLVSSLSYQRETYINYTEKSNLDYKVNLKENNYY